MADLLGPDGYDQQVMAVTPCKYCLGKNAAKEEWTWGRCMTPSEADARLIASAPELLAALKDFVHSVENKDQSWVDGSVVLARAAIAKAEGQS